MDPILGQIILWPVPWVPQGWALCDGSVIPINANHHLSGGGGDDVLQGGRSSQGAWQFRLEADGTLGAVHQATPFAAGARETLASGALDGEAAELAFLAAPRAVLTDMALLYQAAFDRAPDIGGLNWYLAQGVDAASVAGAITASVE